MYVIYSVTYCLLVFESWFLILWKEYRLSAFKSSVIRKLNLNGDEVMEQLLELLNSKIYVFTK